ncbi:DoxX family protein [Streptomyces sp. NPDC051940]|uniref:DoxX family protein n=1 Tax=Streptomyces sp. NPDC051940 TaxID=3155675 RepID=UPI00343DC33B
MFTAIVIVAVVLAALLAVSAALKLSHRPDVVAGYARVGVPEERLNALAGLLLAGAAGLLAGLFLKPLGVAAAACLTCYFLLACAAHVRSRDTAHLPTPLVLLALAAAELLLLLA